MPFVSCYGKNAINDSFVDWAPFVSAHYDQHSFTFFNLTRLTYLTFTNFSSTFHLHGQSIGLTFINGMDEIGENAFQPFHEYTDSSIEITFTSPLNFQLADYAFGRGGYYELDIDSIQYSYIHNLPYQLNLKSMDAARFYQMNIRNSGDMELISNGSSIIGLSQITVSNCSLTNVSFLIESLSTGLASLDLTSNHLTTIPSLENFQHLRTIDLKNNSIEEITVNIFKNMVSLDQLDLSNNRIRNIEANSFVGSRLTKLNLDNNHIISLEILTIDNETTSFLYPLNESLTLLVLSNNFLHNLNPLKHLINLDNVTICCNQIKTLNGNTFEKAHKLKSVDLSYNQIEFIDSMTFNGTIINYLNLAGNRFSSLETNQPLLSNTSLFTNQTSSFLYPISSTISFLSFSNCTNLIDINWFIIIKLQTLFYMDLSHITMTEKSWFYQKTDVNSEDSSINWNYPPGPRIILYGIRFTDNDYCLTKSVVHILNKTILIVDIDHPCNCFLYSFDTEHRPFCLYNQSIVDELSRRCTSMDQFCELFLNNTTTLPFTERTSLSSLSATMQTTSAQTITTLTSPSTLATTEQSIITSTHASSEKSNGNQKTKIILATIIPSTFVIVLCLIGIYLYRRKQISKLTHDIEMHYKILRTTDKG